jgi:hypothetical protein
MGYSGRYHAASLAAVFLALAVGILIGVGFGSDIVSGTADDLEQSLQSDIEAKDEQIENLEADLVTERQFSKSVAPAVVDGRLSERDVALVAFGALDDGLTDDIRAALEPAGANLREIAVVREPPDSAAIDEALPRKRARGESREDQLARAGRLAGKALIRGGDRFDALRTALFARYSGDPGGLDGVVIVREQPDDMSDREAADTALLEDGMIEGMDEAFADLPGTTPVTIVGAETTDTDSSSIEFFADRGVSSVDNVDQLSGQVALVYALAGAEGEFGVKETAQALLPDLLAPVGD